MSTKHKDQGKMQPKGQILNAIHRLIEFIGKWIYTFIAFLKGPAESQPPIKDLTLLHSATTLALKIRNKQVNLLCSSNTNQICLQMTCKISSRHLLRNKQRL